jgi:hypothetical protein
MAKRIFVSAGWTPTGVADATNFTDNGYKALQNGGSTQLTKIVEIDITGLASASAPTPLLYSFDSTLGATALALGTNDTDAFIHASATALSTTVTAFSSSTTKPQRSNAARILNLGLNAFGGIRRWVAAPDEEIWMYGTATSKGETSLSCYNNGTPGLIASHIIYETV